MKLSIRSLGTLTAGVLGVVVFEGLGSYASGAPNVAAALRQPAPDFPRAVLVTQIRPANSVPDRYNYGEYGVDINAFALNGYVIGAFNGYTPEQFVDDAWNSPAIIFNRLVNHRNAELRWTVQQAVEYTGLVMMDAEGPVHPRLLNLIEPTLRATVIRRYGDAILQVRAMYPNAEIALFGMPTPSGQGIPPGRAEANYEVVLSDHPGFDQLNTICPTLYPRWGPGDIGTPFPEYRFDTRTRLVEKTRDDIVGPSMVAAFGMADAALVQRGRRLRVLPIVGFKVENPRSLDEGYYALHRRCDPRLIHTLVPIIEAINDGGADRLGFWISWGDGTLGEQIPDGMEIGAYFKQIVFYADQPYIRRPGDADRNGVLTLPELQSLILNIRAADLLNDPRFDLDDDGDVDEDDVTLATSFYLRQ